MAITSAFCNSAKEQFLTGSHTPAHTYKIALYQSLASLDATTTVYTATQEVTGSGYVAGGTVLSGYAHNLTAGVAYLDWTVDPVWTVASFTSRGALIYNTSGNLAIAAYDFGAEFTSTSGSFTVVLPAAAAATAIIRIA